jgi:flagellar hook-associated protein 2
MTGTITFGGVGSGLDTESIVSGLVKASQGPLTAMKAQASGITAANTSLSNIASLLGKLQTALEAVDETKEIGSYSASSSNPAIIASATGAALPGSYSISVGKLAAEQRTYSNGVASSTTALGQSGNLGLSIAGGAVSNIAIGSTDTLENIASKINSAGLRVSASVFHDGTQYRLQVRGLDTGAANTVSFSGTTLGLDVSANTRQKAGDAELTIDDFTITRPTNQVLGAIPGVTLNLTATTATAANVKVESDPKGLEAKLNSVVSAYNAVVDMVHTVSGFGSAKASVAALAGDSLLRSLTNRMSSALGTAVGTGSYTTLGSVGVKLDNTGHMSLDSAKLGDALAADPAAVAKVIAGPESGTGAGTGVADLLRDVVKAFTQAGTGSIADKQTGLASRLKNTNARVDHEQDRLDAYAAALRKQFTALDGLMNKSTQNSTYLSNFFK